MVHLREALASALDQTLPPREVIVVDDASRPEVAPQLTELEPHGVRVIRSPDRIGGGAARNLGWRQAQTELVAFLDDDDTWRREKCELQARLFRDPEIAFSWTAYRIVEGLPPRLRAEVRPAEAVFEKLLARSELSNCTLMVRKSALEAVGGYDERLPRNQDWDLYLRLVSGFRGAYLDEPLTTVLHHVPDPEACIRGRELLMEKWAPSVGSLETRLRREVEAEHHWLLWGNHALLGNLRQEAFHLFRALSLRPLRWRYLRSLGITLLHSLGLRGRHAASVGRTQGRPS